MPEVTIIVPCYNYAKFLGYCINSILSQTMPDFEILVINDGSPDNTDEVMAGLLDSRIRYIKHSQNKGHVYTYNEGIDSARGEYILVLSADDAIKPDFLKACLDKFKEDKGIGLVFTRICTINGENEEIEFNVNMFRPQKKSGEIKLSKILLSLNCIPHCSAIAPRVIFQKIGKYDSNLPYPCDWDMWLRIAKKYKVWYIDEPLAAYRIHLQNQFKRVDMDRFARDIIFTLDKFYSENVLPWDVLRVKKLVYANAYLAICYKYFKSGQVNTARRYIKKTFMVKPLVIFNPKFLFYSLRCITIWPMKVKRILAFPADLCIFLFLTCPVVFYAVFLKFYSAVTMHKRRRAVINLIPGMDMSSLSRQMGSLGIDRALRINPQGYFDKSLYIYYSSPVDSRKEFNDKNIFIETKMPLGLFYLVYQIKFFCTVLNVALKEKVELIHSAAPYETGLIGYAAAVLADTAFCVSIRTEYDDAYTLNRADSVTIFGSRKIAKAVERFILKRSKLVMVRSESLAKYAAINGARNECIRIEPFGLPVEYFMNQPAVQKNGKVVLSSGRLTPYNYFQDVIEIAKQVLISEPAVSFVIAGDGPQRSALETAAKSLGIEKNIVFVGWKSLDELSKLRASADVNLCLKGGNSLVEAALSARPVVTYDVDWHTELIKDGETGLVVAESNTITAAAAVLRLLNDPVLSAQLGNNARQAAKSRHDYNVVSSEKIRWIKELVDTRCAA